MFQLMCKESEKSLVSMLNVEQGFENESDLENVHPKEQPKLLPCFVEIESLPLIDESPEEGQHVPKEASADRMINSPRKTLENEKHEGTNRFTSFKTPPVPKTMSRPQRTINTPSPIHLGVSTVNKAIEERPPGPLPKPLTSKEILIEYQKTRDRHSRINSNGKRCMCVDCRLSLEKDIHPRKVFLVDAKNTQLSSSEDTVSSEYSDSSEDTDTSEDSDISEEDPSQAKKEDQDHKGQDEPSNTLTLAEFISNFKWYNED